LEAVIVDQADVPVYLRIAEKAKHLRELGMSDRAIARALDVSDKTVTKAIMRANSSEKRQPSVPASPWLARSSPTVRAGSSIVSA
jgi:transposase